MSMSVEPPGEEAPSTSATGSKKEGRHFQLADKCRNICCSFRKLGLVWIALLSVSTSVLTTVLLTMDGYASTTRNDDDGAAVDWILVGGITATSATFRVRAHPRGSARLLTVSETAGLVPGTFVLSSDLRGDNDGGIGGEEEEAPPVRSATASDLMPDTKYYYATVDDDGRIVKGGSFRTAPATPASSSSSSGDEYVGFKIAAAGCAWTGSQSSVFTAIADESPLLFLHLGDFHYEDISINDVDARIRAVDRVMSSRTQSDLYSRTGLVYMWDDHDYLGNDSGGYGRGRTSALESYRLAFPVYGPLPASSSSSSSSSSSTGPKSDASATATEEEKEKEEAVSPYQAFTIGTVRFVLSDLRSEASDASIYSQKQRQWLLGELSAAASYDFVVWITTKPWIGPADPTDDGWSGYAKDRAELSDFISRTIGGEGGESNGPRNLLVLSADMHALAFDDGTNTYYGGEVPEGKGDGGASAGRAPSFPILHSGPLDRMGSAKGGPFTDGCHAIKADRNSQYSTLEFFREDQTATSDGIGDGNVNSQNGTAANNGNGTVPCVRIRSYRIGDAWGPTNNDKKEEVFNRKLCGDIFSPSGDGDVAVAAVGSGSCSIPLISTTTLALAAAAGGLGTLTIVAAIIGLDGYRDAVWISIIVILAYATTVIAGWGIPFALGVRQYDAAVFVLITLLCMGAFLVFVLLWIRKERRMKTYIAQVDDGGIVTEDVT